VKLRERIPALSYDRPVTVLVGFMALLVVGIIAYTRIPVQLMPSGFEPKFMFALVFYPDSAPIETDERIVRPVEEQLSTVSGMNILSSTASTGTATFRMQFHGSTDMDEAYNAVVDRIERAMPELPDDVDRYLVFSFNPDDSPVLWLGVSLPEQVEDPYHLMTRVVQPRIERISGVASVDVYGVPKQIVAIDYDREKLFAHLVDLGGVQRRLATDNFQIGSGQIRERGQIRPLRGLSNLTQEDLARFPVRDSLVLGDIADIRSGGVLNSDLFRIDGEKAAAIAVRKESGANIVEVAEAVIAELEALEDAPRAEGARFHTLFNQGDLITESVDTLTNTALTGGVFALLILYVFLREWKMTLLIAASIPLSLLLTVMGLYFMGFDLNVISLMGLMLAVGMVVDNAIVVVETIYRRRAEGSGVRAAAVLGTAEVNLAILASTMTTMVVFLPVMLMTENADFSFFLQVMGMPVVLALAASLLVALVFAPLATRYMGRAAIKSDPAWLKWIERRYRAVLTAVMARRSDTVLAMLFVGVLTLGVAVPGVQWSLTGGDGNIGDFTIRFTVPPQAGMAQRDAILQAYEEMVDAHREEWGVRVFRGELRGDRSMGQMWVYLESDGPMSRDEVMAAAREALPDDLPGVQGSVGWEGGADGGDRSLSLQIEGEDMGMLVALGEEVVRRVEGVEGVIGARLDQEREGADEVQLTLLRDALARYAVGAQQVGNTVAYALRGSTLQPLKEGEREIELRSRFSLEDRSDIDTVLDFEIWSPERMAFVPIRVLTDVVFTKGPVSITRTNRKTSVGVTVDLAEGVTRGEAFRRVDAALEDMAFPRGTSWKKAGGFDMEMENNSALYLAFALSLAFVYLLMGILFERWILPLGIMTTVPMAMFGSMWGLYLTGTTVDTMAGIGLVVLVGVVVNNGIVLIDLVTQLRNDGMERTEALVEAGCRRLRPILMTALTTICGLLPMALGSSSFIGIPYAPLGRTVVSGLAVGTVLTLILVPFLYAWLDDFATGALRWSGYVARGWVAPVRTRTLHPREEA
jgi:HAE1 family hydrophobic/amphiphilic exporter-1